MDAHLEVVVIPVSDVDRAKAFYSMFGWRLDADVSGDEYRLVQLTPPGSAIQFGSNLTPAPPRISPWAAAERRRCRGRAPGS